MIEEIHQVLVGAAPGDAVTNLALETRARLRRRARSEIYAFHVAPELQGDVRWLRHFDASPSDRRVIVYHSSIGEPPVTRFLLSRSERIVLVYHNITPAEHFENVDRSFSRLLAWGRTELSILRPQVVRAVADSAFNAHELVAYGYELPEVLPLGVRADRLLTEPFDADTVRLLDAAGGPFVLAVGQQLPHKRFEDVISAVHLAQTYLRSDVTLVLAGRPTLPSYAAALRRHAADLLMSRVLFVQPDTDAALATLFRRAAVYLSASAHEGLGIPALEAMSFGIPVVVRAAGAVADTVGSGGLVLPAEATVAHLAEAVATVLSDGLAAANLARAGLRRANQWDADAAAARFDAILAEVG